jgi:thiol-disulfide isomerase/thioredoxin
MQASDRNRRLDAHRRQLMCCAAGAALLACGAAQRAAAQSDPAKAPARPESFEPATPLGRGGDGKEWTLAALHPRALVVCLWAAWCPHCRNEMAALEKLQRAVAPEHLRVVLVNTEPAADWRRVRRALDGQLRSMLTHDDGGDVRKAFAAPESVPYTVVIGRDGRSHATLSGWSEDRLDWLVERANAALAATPRPG